MIHKNIYVPRDLADPDIKVVDIQCRRGDRVRRNQVLLLLQIGNVIKPITSLNDGWVRFVAVNSNDSVKLGQLLAIIDVVAPNEFRADSDELNALTELGEKGRRGEERQGQSKHGEGYSKELFDAPEKHEGMAHQSSLEEHPFTRNMKEGVPAKMTANAAQNDPAIKNLEESAGNDPELRKQLSNELTQSLSLSAAPSMSPPTPTPGCG